MIRRNERSAVRADSDDIIYTAINERISVQGDTKNDSFVGGRDVTTSHGDCRQQVCMTKSAPHAA
jgi:hypothetical protein